MRASTALCEFAQCAPSSAAELAGLVHRYPEVGCGPMIARQIVHQLLALLAALMGGAKPRNSPFEDITKRKSARRNCSTRFGLRIARHEKLPTRLVSTLSSFLLCGHPIAARR
jgi:hypothetical protein